MDLETVRTRAEEMMARVEQLRDGYAGLQRELLVVRATATSDDGLVTVTVGPRGQVVDLELSPRIYRRPDSRRLAETILSTIQQAAAEAIDKVAGIIRPFVPDDQLRAYMKYDFDGALRRMDHELAGDDE